MYSGREEIKGFVTPQMVEYRISALPFCLCNDLVELRIRLDRSCTLLP